MLHVIHAMRKHKKAPAFLLGLFLFLFK